MITRLEKISGKSYDDAAHTFAFRVIIDHVRGSVFMLSDGINRYRTALRFTDHPKNTSVFQHHFRKTVHPGGSRRTRGANDLIAHRVNRPNVVNKPPFEVYAVRQTLVSDPFVRRISSS